MSWGIKDFSLQPIFRDAEYLRIYSRYFLQDIRTKYNIGELIAPNGYVYCKIKREICGLEHAAKLVRDQLIKNLVLF